MRFSVISFATPLVLLAVGCAQAGSSVPNGVRNANDSTAVRRTAQQGDSSKTQQGDSTKTPPRRLESVTWNSVSHELTWVVSSGEKKGADYKPLKSDKYLIRIDDATMTFNGETRRFSKEEASNVLVLMDLISKYAAESTIWWEDGQGEPLNGNGKPNAKPKQVQPKQQPQGQPQEQDRQPQGGADDDVAILHVAWTPQTPVNARALDVQIRDLETRLAALKQLRSVLDRALQVASY